MLLIAASRVADGLPIKKAPTESGLECHLPEGNTGPQKRRRAGAA